MVVFKLTPYLLQILQFTSNGAVNTSALSMAYGSSKQCIKNMKAEEGDSLGIFFFAQVFLPVIYRKTHTL